ncbi:MAG: hypothetical protein C4305_03650 [Thermoleophilia bacterium]
MLDASGVVGKTRALGRAGGLVIYTARGKGGATCYLTGTPTIDDGARVGSAFCPDPAARPALPSAEVPLLDLSTYAVREKSGETRLIEAAGIAVDGIARVGFVTASGQTL